MRAQIDAQKRGMLKTVGVVPPSAGNSDIPIQRAEKLIQGHPVMSSLIARLAELRRHIAMQVAALDREVRAVVRSELTLKRLMSVSGIGAPAFLSAVDHPATRMMQPEHPPCLVGAKAPSRLLWQIRNPGQ